MPGPSKRICVKAGGTGGTGSSQICTSCFIMIWIPPGYLQLLQNLGHYFQLLQIWLPLVPPVPPVPQAFTHTLQNPHCIRRVFALQRNHLLKDVLSCSN